MSGTGQPVLAADGGLLLRPWEPDDAEAVEAAYADPAIRQWHGRSMTAAEARTWVAAWPETWRAETGASWAVTDGTGVLGQAGLRRIDLADGDAAISYWVLPAARGRRVAPRALAAVTGWALGELGLHRLELRHATGNTASCRVAGHAGYPLDGTLRSAALHPDGWHDMHVHAMLGRQ